jgi:dTDP-4-amino-4,6-dideoxy-D-galactose acyltransferase
MSKICQFLEWDSQFFGKKIAKVTDNFLTPETTSVILNWCESHEIDCLYFLADSNDATTIRLAEANGFRFVDIRLTFERYVDTGLVPNNGDFSGSIRSNTASDIPALRDIARLNHRDSRFYFDSNFYLSQCDALYKTWIDQSCRGYADAVLVVTIKDQPVGYISCHLRGQSRGQIGLLGIDAKHRGKGLGRHLVSAAFHWFNERDVAQVTVVTQGRNCPAQRLYQRCGFLTQKVELWYHRWFES